MAEFVTAVLVWMVVTGGVLIPFLEWVYRRGYRTPVIWNNVVTAPNRWMAYWLRRRGWVCFYLEEQARHCGPHPDRPGDCWLRLYQDGERRPR